MLANLVLLLAFSGCCTPGRLAARDRSFICDSPANKYLWSSALAHRHSGGKPRTSTPLSHHVRRVSWSVRALDPFSVRARVTAEFVTRRLARRAAEQVQGAPRVERSTSRLIEPRLCMLAATLVGRARANSPAHPTSPANPQSLSVVAGPSDQRGLCPDLGESCCLVARLCPTWSLPLGLATWFRCAGPERVRAAAKVKHPVSMNQLQQLFRRKPDVGTVRAR